MDIVEIGKIALLCSFAYLFGSIPFGYIVTRAKGIDIQKVGSGNIGGTNVGRALGLKYALLVGFLDAWKGAVPVTAAMYFFYSSWLVVGFVLLFCLLGAVWSIWLKIKLGSFRAGKGVSTLIGGLLVLVGWQWLIIIGCWLIAFFFFVRHKVSAASLILAASILFLVHFIPILLYIAPATLLIVGVIWWAHRENIKRIARGVEPSMKLPKFFEKVPDDIIGLLIDKLKGLKNKD
jgi:glycerol-3-phosphate acyltransferase PlsY